MKVMKVAIMMMNDANPYTIPLVILFSIIGGVVVAVEYKNIQKMVVRVKNKTRERENYKKMAKMHFLKYKSIFQNAMSHADQPPRVQDSDHGTIDGISIPFLDVTLISDEIKAIVNELDLPEDLQDELYGMLKDIPPEEHLDFLINFFGE